MFLTKNSRSWVFIAPVITLALLLSSCAENTNVPTAAPKEEISIQKDCLLVLAAHREAKRVQARAIQDAELARVEREKDKSKKSTLQKAIDEINEGASDSAGETAYVQSFMKESMTIWPKVNDADLKEALKSLSRGEYAFESYTAAQSICNF